MLDPSYVTGFCDTAGSFTYSRSGQQISLYFAVKLSRADRSLLEDIQEFFGGVGRIYDLERQAYLRVTHREDLAAVVEHFDGYPLRTQKQRAYEIWREMVLLKRAFRSPDRTALTTLAARLSETRALG